MSHKSVKMQVIVDGIVVKEVSHIVPTDSEGRGQIWAFYKRARDELGSMNAGHILDPKPIR